MWGYLYGKRFGLKIFISSYLPAYEDETECSETSAYKIKMPGNYPEESVQHSEQGESLKSRMIIVINFGIRGIQTVCVTTEQLQTLYDTAPLA